MRYSDGVLPMVRFRRIQLFLGFLGALIVIGRVLFDGFQLEDIGPGELQKPSAGEIIGDKQALGLYYHKTYSNNTTGFSR